jgi:hypothetical protein
MPNYRQSEGGALRLRESVVEPRSREFVADAAARVEDR